MISIILLPQTSYAQSANDTVNINGTSYVISHTIEGGKILGINLDSQSKTLMILIHPSTNGSLTIDLPRILIDAKVNGSDTHYTVLVNNHGANFKELITADYREITISFPNGTNTIAIRGTQVVPEFGPMVSFIFVTSIMTTIIISQKFKQNTN